MQGMPMQLDIISAALTVGETSTIHRKPLQDGALHMYRR